MRIKDYVIVLTLALASCDTFYGIYRSSVIKTMPNIESIKRAISSVNGIDNVTYKLYGGSSETHTFFYKGGSNIYGQVSLVRDRTGKIDFLVSSFRSNRIPSQGEVDANYAIMLKIEESIEKQCGIDGLSRSMREASSAEVKHK